MIKQRLGVSAAGTMAVLFASSLSTQAWAIEFRNFFGSGAFAHNQMSYDQPLFDSALCMTRRDFLWSQYEPTPGVFNDAYMQSYIDGLITSAQAQDVQFLPILCYNTAWSYDKTARTYYNTADGQANGAYGQATRKYDITPLGNDQFQYTVSNWTQYSYWDSNFPFYHTSYHWTQASQTTIAGVNAIGDSVFPIAADQLPARAEFLTRVVNAMKPAGVKYFQIWNEASQTSGYWHGGFDTYMQRIHLPDAATIHAAGGKVVYGGWPSDTSIQTYINVMNANNAWGSVDVLDVHYRALADIDTLYNAAAAAGHPEIGIWQTEYGFTSAEGTIGNVNPRFLNWALKHNGSADPDRYRMLWFALQSVPEFGQGNTLYKDDGKTLSNHGISLDTLSRLLGGKNLGLLNGVTNSRGWTASLDEGSDSIESFISDVGRVVVMHTSATSGTVTLTIPGFAGYDLKAIDAYRVDQSGYKESLADSMSLSGDNLIVDVNIADNAASPVKGWNLGTTENTIYVQVAVPEPSAALTLLGGGGMLLLGRRTRHPAAMSVAD